MARGPAVAPGAACFSGGDPCAVAAAGGSGGCVCGRGVPAPNCCCQPLASFAARSVTALPAACSCRWTSPDWPPLPLPPLGSTEGLAPPLSARLRPA